MSKRTLLTYYSSSSNANTSNTDEGTSQPKKSKVEFCFSDIIGDPGNRKPIDHYAFEIRDQVKRAYALSGPTQPVNHTFPRRWQSGEWRSFQKKSDLRRMIGWSIVSQRMQPFACIVIFSLRQESLKNLE